jgi:hypothetical protein
VAKQQVGGDHIVAALLHVKIIRESSESDPNKAFSAEIIGPGFNETLPIGNGSSKTFTLSGVSFSGIPANPTVLAEVDDFTLVPPGPPANASALHFTIVFKIVEIFKITIGNVPVTVSLK